MSGDDYALKLHGQFSITGRSFQSFNYSLICSGIIEVKPKKGVETFDGFISPLAVHCQLLTVHCPLIKE